MSNTVFPELPFGTGGCAPVAGAVISCFKGTRGAVWAEFMGAAAYALDAPEWLPAGSTVGALDSRGEPIERGVTGRYTTREDC